MYVSIIFYLTQKENNLMNSKAKENGVPAMRDVLAGLSSVKLKSSSIQRYTVIPFYRYTVIHLLYKGIQRYCIFDISTIA